MNKLSTLLIGILAFFLLAWLGLVAIPYVQLSRLQPLVDEDTGDVYPRQAPGVASEGKAVYVANGCVNCHTQQVRPGHAGTDIARKWGTRQTVARDYLYDNPLVAGTTRVGPDLANIGMRRPEAEWHYKHLYRPRSVSRDSIMPPFRFLFKTRRITGERSADALDLTGADAPPKGFEVVPTDDARALVQYLLSLNRTHPVPEAVQEAKEEEKKEEKPPAAGAASPASPAVSTFVNIAEIGAQ